MHCHALLWVALPSKIHKSGDIDKYITTDLPDPTLEPALYRTVTTCMFHSPCGWLKSGAQCMQDNKCKKNGSPNHSILSQVLMRMGAFITKDVLPCIEFYIVVYASIMAIWYHTTNVCAVVYVQINIEHCGWNMMIGYLFKDVSKGVEIYCIFFLRATGCC